AWPAPDPAFLDPAAEAEMEDLMEIVRAIRNIRAEVGVAPGKKISARILASPERAAVLSANRASLAVLAGLGQLEIAGEEVRRPEQAMSAVAGGVQIYLPLADLVDLEKERLRLGKELESARAEAARLEAKLANEGFLAKAPAAVVERERTRLEEARAKAEKICARLRELGFGAEPLP
ncbi:MAG: valine--tRNA ligase, partial [Firmicutes bacterium]|nr:valine--tRNA ligase [Bacillota bacterium]